MAATHLSSVIGHMSQFLCIQERANQTDAELLESYVTLHEQDAFAALVRRHGPMVWSVCRRLLRNPGDAEDAFQATFLILVRKAPSVWPHEQLGPWLHGVAQLTARKARALALRRLAREKPLHLLPEDTAATIDPTPEWQTNLDLELSGLPEKYRVLLVLCDLEGRTRREVAAILGCPEGTVAGRLVRARAMLARRLSRHGYLLSVPVLTAFLAHEARAGTLPVRLLKTIHSASHLFTLTEGVLHTMSLGKIQGWVVLLLTVGALLLGIGWFSPLAEGGGFVTAATLPVASPSQEGKAGSDQRQLSKQLQGIPWYLVHADPEARTIKVSDSPVAGTNSLDQENQIFMVDPYGHILLEGLSVAKDAKITLDGKPARLGQLRPGLQLTIRFAENGQTIMSIEAAKPQPELRVKAVDADKNTITVTLGPDRTFKELPVAKDVYIYFYHKGNPGPLKEVEAGMRATIKLVMENGQLIVKDIRVRK